MLYDLSFLDKGKPFPPKGESKRISNYKKNFNFYDGEYSKIRKATYSTLDQTNTVKFDVRKLNLYKVITNKFIALLLNEKPVVKVSGKYDDKKIAEVLSNSDFWGVIKNSTTSFSSVGDGLINTYNGVNGPSVVATNPSCWYKVVNQSNISEVLYHVLMWKMEDNEHIKVQIHERGKYSEYVCEYSGKGIGDKVAYKRKGIKTIPKRGRVVNTGLSDFAISSISNNTSVNNIYGTSDYSDVVSFIMGVEKIMAELEMLVDKTIEPILVGPSSMLIENELTGKAEYKKTDALTVNSKDSVQPYFLETTGKSEVAENLADRYMGNIYTITEYGEVFFTGSYANASGKSLEIQMKPALDKASRQIDTIDYPIKKSIVSLLELAGIRVSISDISINWQDGINESLKAITETINTRVTAGTLSKKSALMQYDNMTEEQADDEIQRINVEKKVSGTVETKTKEEGGTT